MARSITLNELDTVLQSANELINRDYRGAMAMLNDVTVSFEPMSLADPFSQDYAAWVMSTYLRVAQLDRYDAPRHEADTNVQEQRPLASFFPFSTQDMAFTGRYLTGVGMILMALDLPPGSRIVEYGVGWAHVSAALCRAGHDVTCVDIEPKFLALAARQAEAMGGSVRIHCGRFGERPYPLDAPGADAVVFFEAFHHAFDHLDVLRRLRREVLAPGGKLVLAAEPVHPAFPQPWGIRPDGHALWAVRQHKWMELGFQEDYLVAALLREGFLVTKTWIEPLGSFGLVYAGTLHQGSFHPGRTMLPAGEAASWAKAPDGGEDRRWAGMDSRATLDQHEQWTVVEVKATNHLPVALQVSMDAGGAGPAVSMVFGPGETHTHRLPLGPGLRQLRVWSETAVPAELGVNNDTRRLGIAIEQVTYRHD